MYIGIVVSSDNPLTSFSFSSPVYGISDPLTENILHTDNKYKYNYRLDIKRIDFSNVDNFYAKFYIKAPVGSKLYYQFYFNLNLN